MIYLLLFLEFFKIGLISFGGGYAMIPLILEVVLKHQWLTEEEMINFIAVAESTPGPIAVNMATFIGSSQAGIIGSLIATLGVVLPSFIIILIIAAVFTKFLKYKNVNYFLNGIKPTIIGLIVSTSFILFLNVILNYQKVNDTINFNYKGLIIFIILIIITISYSIIDKTLNKKTNRERKTISPIILIIISGILGMIFF